MLEILIEPRRSFSLKTAVMEAIGSGDYDSLYDDIRDCFTEYQVEQIEEVLDSGDIGEAIDEIVSEWNGEDLEELFETIALYFADSSIEIQFVKDEDFVEDVSESDFEYDDLDGADTDDDDFEEAEDSL